LSVDHIDGEPRVGVVPGADSYGPAMAALSHKRQLFVLNLFQGCKTYVEAYEKAGFGTPTSNGRTMKNGASRLACDERIQAAVHEVGKHFIGAGAAIAYRQAMFVLEHPEHRDFGRIVGLFLDRAWPVQSVQKISVDHTHNYEVSEVEELAKRLAAEAGMPPEWLLGPNRTTQPMKLIEGTTTIVKQENDDGKE
jgi:hypothetical protein